MGKEIFFLNIYRRRRMRLAEVEAGEVANRAGGVAMDRQLRPSTTAVSCRWMTSQHHPIQRPALLPPIPSPPVIKHLALENQFTKIKIKKIETEK
jgi:hypothetical protein